METELICSDCQMVFHSAGLQQKHKALLCIGSQVEHLQRDTPGWTRTSDLVLLRAQRRMASSWRSDDVKPTPARSDEPAANQTERAALQHLTQQFDRLRTSIEEHLPEWSKRNSEPEPEVGGRQPGHRERLEEMKEMTKLHEKQLALIRRQRDELVHQVNFLSESSSTHLENLLLEDRNQEDRNQETLAHVRRVSASSDQPDQRQNKKTLPDCFKLGSDGPLSTQIQSLLQEYMQAGGSDPDLVTQMIHLQAEAQNLERNQPVTSTEAKNKKMKPPAPPPPLPPPPPRWELLAVEQENQRLEEEIFRMQLAREKLYVCDALRRQPPPPPPPPLPPRSHLHAPPSLLQVRSSSCPLGGHSLDPLDPLDPAPYDPAAGLLVFYDLVLGVDVSQRTLRLVAALYSEGQEVGPPTPLPLVQCMSGRGPAPGHYAVLLVQQLVPGIQPSSSLSLVVELQAARHLDVFRPESCGWMRHLDVFRPESCSWTRHLDVFRPESCGWTRHLDIFRPESCSWTRHLDVFRPESCGWTRHLDIFRPESCGWTRLELFDQLNQLRSGHWRAPLRSPPIRTSFSPAQLNSVPQVGNMELCLRLVNGRDGDVQSLVKVDPTRTAHYKYPAVVSSTSVHQNAAPHLSGGTTSPPVCPPTQTS